MQNINAYQCIYGNGAAIFLSKEELRSRDPLPEMHRSSLCLFFHGPLVKHWAISMERALSLFLWPQICALVQNVGYNEFGITWQSLPGAPRVTWPAHGSREGWECNMGMK